MTDEQYGEAAFKRGLDCIPALDSAFMALLRADEPPQTGSVYAPMIKRLKAWHRGWAMANLAAPLPEETTCQT